MRFGHILVCHSYVPTKLIESITKRCDHPWFVFIHSRNEAVISSINEFAASGNVRILEFGFNRGLAKSWNDGIEMSITDGCDAVLILNDDIFFYKNAYTTFLSEAAAAFENDRKVAYVTCNGKEEGASQQKGQVISQDFSCIAISRDTINKVGAFDENFFPAYFEDSDYHRRCILSGLTKHVIPITLIEHERSSTVQSFSVLEREELAVAMRKNHGYYQRKWGTPEPFFTTPFNQGYSLAIALADRVAPYPDHNRQDKNVDHEIASKVPANHYGVIYTEVMKLLSQKRRSRSYLEIGVNTGNLIQHIHTDVAIGVDPDFSLNVNPMLGKKKAVLYQMTSDEFFANDKIVKENPPVDLAFLDGMHTFEFLLRDFFNTEKLCTPRSLIVMHDCLPLNEEMTNRNFAHSLEIGRETAHPLYWTGDVWKIIPILQKYRPDLKMIFADAPPTGLVFVTRLDATSTELSDRYAEIVEEFRSWPSTIDAIAQLYESIKLTSTREILQDHDHTLYFRN